MLGQKKPKRPAEPTTHGWREVDLKMLTATLKGDRPSLQTALTGFRHGITFDGETYSSKLRGLRSDHNLYRQSSLLFDEMPGDENSIPMIAQQNELFGTFLFNRVRAKGYFSVASNFEDLGDFAMGWAAITARYETDDIGTMPLLEFGFTVSTEQEQRSLQDAIRGAVTSATAYLNLSVEKVQDVDEWLAKFNRDGYSPELRVKRVYIGAEAGNGFFD